MRKIRDVFRLRFEAGTSERQIADTLGVARSTVQEALRRAREAGLTWPLPPELTEVALQARLYPHKVAAATIPLPDCSAIHAELSRKGVTRALLWQEYKAAHADGLEYSAFCDHYRPMA